MHIDRPKFACVYLLRTTVHAEEQLHTHRFNSLLETVSCNSFEQSNRQIQIYLQVYAYILNSLCRESRSHAIRPGYTKESAVHMVENPNVLYT